MFSHACFLIDESRMALSILVACGEIGEWGPGIMPVCCLGEMGGVRVYEIWACSKMYRTGIHFEVGA